MTSRRRFPSVLLAGVLAAMPARPAAADLVIVSESSQFAPEVVLNPDGPTGTIHAMAFGADGRRLYLGGTSKTVQAWGFGDGPGGVRMQRLREYRWPVTRGQRGHVYAVALSPTMPLMALGGYSAWGSNGDIVVYDLERGEVVTALRGAGDGRHASSIQDLAFAPDGRHLLSTDLMHGVRLWTVPPRATLFPDDGVPPADEWPGRQVRAAETTRRGDRLCLGRFLAADRFLTTDVPQADGAQGLSQVRVGDLAVVRRWPPAAHPQGVHRLAVEADGRRFATTSLAENRTRIFAADAAGPPAVMDAAVPVTSLAFSGDGRLLATVQGYTTPEGTRYGPSLQAWQVDPGRPGRLRQIDQAPLQGNPARGKRPRYRLAVVPGGGHAAVLDDATNALTVFDVRLANGGPKLQPLKTVPARTFAPGSSGVQDVAFSTDGALLGVRDRVGPDGPRSFDRVFGLDPWGMLAAPPQARWQAPHDTPAGWQVQADLTNDLRLRLFQDGRPRGEIVLDGLEPDNRVYAADWCWLHEGGRPYAFAVAAEYPSCGIYVFGRGPDDTWTLVRYCRDHSDSVTSLAVHPAGSVLASGSLDRTVKLWPLDGLKEACARLAAGRLSETQLAQVRLGGTWEMADDALRLTSVRPDGILALRGMRAGDRIVFGEFSEFGDDRVRTGRKVRTDDPQELIDNIVRTPPAEHLMLDVRRPGPPLKRRFYFVSGWEPVASLHVDRRGEHVWYTPFGEYEASIDGDAAFGFQLDRALTKTPEFFAAAALRRRLERPDLLRRILADAGLPVAVPPRPAAAEVARVRAERLSDSLAATVRVRILAPADGAAVAGGATEVVAEVSTPAGTTAGPARLTVNGVPGEQVGREQVGGQVRYRFQAPLPDGVNRLRVVAADPEDPETYAEAAPVFVAAPDQARLDQGRAPGRLHMVTVAVQDYAGVMKLNFPVADVEALTAALRRQTRGLYEPGQVIDFREDQVRRGALRQRLAERLATLAPVRPQDLVVLALSGHGHAFGAEYYMIPKDIPEPEPLPAAAGALRSRLLTVAQREREAWIRTHGIAWDELQPVMDLPCRKLLLLDTCFAGNLLLEGGAVESWRRPARRAAAQDVYVLSATSEAESANEPSLEAARKAGVNNGVFALVLLEGLNDKARRGADGILTLDEWFAYVQRLVPMWTARAKGGPQRPTSMPRDLLDAAPLPLVAEDG